MKKTRTVKISGAFIFVVVFLFVLIIVKLSYVVLSPKVDGIDLAAFANNRNTVKEAIVAERGSIYDALGNSLALNVNSYTVIAYLSSSRTNDIDNPQHVVDKENTAKALSPLINMSYERILDLLNTQDVYQVELGPGGRGITELLKENIEDLNLSGIDFIKSVKRYYPNRDFLSYTLGYAKTNDEGNIIGEMGLELQYDKELTGVDGTKEFESDIYGYKIANTNEKIMPAKNGNDIYLTIDTNIQMFAEQAINKLEEVSPEWATISVMNAKTGEILAVASSPSFDPNTKEITSYYDPFVSYAYEPGSTMKIFSFLSAMENGMFNGDETYKSGTIKVGEFTIKDWNNYGWGTITFREGFYASSNVAAVNLINRVGGEKLKDFYNSLGYGKKVGINLPNEQDGAINFKYESEVASASYGQGMSVTAVQMLQALSVIANDGELIKPYIINKIVDNTTSEVLFENKTTNLGKKVSSESIAQIKEMMWGVINAPTKLATGSGFKTDNVTMIGKTGTAQIASSTGGYLTGNINYVRSFAGLFPYDDPQIIVYAAVSKLSNPNLLNTAVKTLVEDTSTYLGIIEKEESYNESFLLDSYINKDTKNVVDYLNNTKLAVVVIGNGNKIINQYPIKGSKLSSNDKVFLLTNDTTYYYSDINGWSRNDIMRYGKLIGINFVFDGYGYATGSIIKNALINKGETINVILKPKYVVPIVEDPIT